MSHDSEYICNVLVIDDEKAVLDLTSIILKKRGYNVYTASDACTGLELIQKYRPELVMLDYMMPGMDGFTALKEIRKRFPDTCHYAHRERKRRNRCGDNEGRGL